MEAENSAAAKIAAETVEEVDIPCLSRTTPRLTKRGIDDQERITQDYMRRKGEIDLHHDFFVSMVVCLFFNFFVMKLCAVKLV